MKVTIAQINPIVGDIAGNSEKIRQAAQLAKRQGAQLLVTPELAICGYPPKDMLLRGGFVEACDDAVSQLADETSAEFGILVGHPTSPGNHAARPYNAATLLADGVRKQTVHKSLLPNYDVFDEERYFSPGTNSWQIRAWICFSICQPARLKSTNSHAAVGLSVSTFRRTSDRSSS